MSRQVHGLLLLLNRPLTVTLLIEKNTFMLTDTVRSFALGLASGNTTVRGALVASNEFTTNDSISVDTAIIVYNGARPLNNWSITGDSDLSQKIVGYTTKFDCAQST